MEAIKFEYFKRNIGQFDAALEHLVKHNIFLHYSEVLPDVVFCDPQVLLTRVTEIVQYHYKLKHDKIGSVKGTKFVKNAYISAEVLKSMSPDQYGDSDGILPLESFFTLLSHLKIISAIPTSSGNSGVYLMPALLSNVHNPAAKVEEIQGKEHLPPLCINFGEGCAPSGLFCSLMATLLQSSNWKLCMNDGSPECCFRNCVTFTYQETAVITLVDYFSHFSIYVNISTHLNTQKDLTAIRGEIYVSIQSVAKGLQYSNLELQDAIMCPSHPEGNHVALWHREGEKEYYGCTVQNNFAGPVPKEYQVWMKNKGLLKVHS